MFTEIINSFPKQASDAIEHKSVTEEQTTPVNVKSQIAKLTELGFTAADCKKALSECEGNIDNAALWLTQNKTPEQKMSPSNSELWGESKTFIIIAWFLPRLQQIYILIKANIIIKIYMRYFNRNPLFEL